MAFQIIRNDLTKVEADAIVNTANPSAGYGTGTDAAIYEAAGKDLLLAERLKIGDIGRGEAVATPAFALPAKYIIHTVGPSWQGGDAGEMDILRSCYRNSLELALELKCKSVAFPLIASGNYGVPKDKALQIALSVIQPFVMEHSMDVILVVFDRKALELSGRIVENIREYVDSNYVEEARRKEYAEDIRGRRENRSRDRGFLSDRLHERMRKVSIDDLLAASQKTFQERLFEIIDGRGLTGPQVYKGYVTKQVYSKIQANPEYHPTKGTAIALCLSLHLSLDETKDLIGRAGWSLSPSSKADLVVSGCILNGEYNLVNVNLMLFDYDCDTLDKIK